MIATNSKGSNVSAGFVEESTATIRKPCAELRVLWTDAVVDPFLRVESETENHNSLTADGDILKQVVDSIETPAFQYIILDGSWSLDGSKHPGPSTVEEVQLYQIGWYSADICDAGGNFVEPQSVVVNFDPSGRALSGLKVIGDKLLNEHPADFDIIVYGHSDAVLYAKTVTGNNAVGWFESLSEVYGAVKMKLEISKWSRGNTIAKILEFFTLETDVFTEDDIVSLSILEERYVKNGSSPVGNISVNEIELQLQNIAVTASDGVTYKDPFSFGNSENNRFYNFLKPNRKKVPYLGFVTNGVREMVRMGVFWTVGDWRCNEIDFSAFVTGYDRMKFLKDNTFECDEISINMQNKNLRQVAEYVLNHAKVNIPLQDLTWSISNVLESYTVPIVWFGKGSYFDAIKAIAEACVGQAWMSRDDVLCIYPEKIDGELDLEITRDDYFNKNQPSNVEEMKNAISVTVQALLKEAEEEKPVVYEGKQHSIPAQSERTIIIDYRNSPVSESVAELANQSVVGVLSITDAKYFAYGCKITIENTSESAVTCDVIVKAWKWGYSENNSVSVENEALIIEYGKKEEKFENHLIQTRSAAQNIADKLLANYSIPRRDMSLNWRGDPRLELGDIIEVPEYKNNTAKFVVVKNKWTFDGGLSCDTEARKTNEVA